MTYKLYTLDNQFIKETTYIQASFTGIIKPNDKLVHGQEQWCLKGKLHRLDGPAILWHDYTEVWYINGIKCTNQQHHSLLYSIMKLKGLI